MRLVLFVFLNLLFCGQHVFALSHNTIISTQFSEHPCDSPESGAFANYQSKSKMLKFSKYIERPIPLKVWKDTSAYFYFSDTASRDRFRFSVVGDYEYTAMIYFQIITSRGVCVFKDSFTLMSILSMYFDGGGYYATRSQKERALNEYAENFLNAYNREGAIEQLPRELDPEYTIHENHRMLSMDGATNFFVYSKKAENNTFIGFDPILGYALIFYDTQY